MVRYCIGSVKILSAFSYLCFASSMRPISESKLPRLLSVVATYDWYATFSRVCFEKVFAKFQGLFRTFVLHSSMRPISESKLPRLLSVVATSELVRYIFAVCLEKFFSHFEGFFIPLFCLFDTTHIRKQIAEIVERALLQMIGTIHFRGLFGEGFRKFQGLFRTFVLPLRCDPYQKASCRDC